MKVTEILKLYAPEGGEGGADTTKVVDAPAQDGPQGEPGQEQFDPSKYDVSDPDVMGTLTDEQIQAVEKYNSGHGDAPDGAPAKTDTATTDTAPEGAKGDPPNAAVKLAGKYDKPEDLVKGVRELAAKLGYPEESIDAVVELATEAKSFARVEALYKSMESKLGSRSTADAAGTPAAAPEQPKRYDPPSDAETAKAVAELTQQGIMASSVVRAMQAEGIAVPTNMEEFAVLAKEHPYHAMQFQQTFRELYQENLNEAREYIKAAQSVDSHNAQVMAKDVEAIRALAAEGGFVVSDAELAQLKSVVLQRPQALEERHGHKFLREDALKEAFLVTLYPSKFKEAAIAKELAGRQQAVKDLEAATKKELNGIGASNISTKSRVAPKMPDLTDPDVVAGLPDEALNDPDKYFSRFAK